MLQQLQQRHDNIIFNKEQHTYHINGKQFTPATTLINKFYQEFDKSKAKNVAKRERVSEQEILDRWQQMGDDAREFGHQIHNFGEAYGRHTVDGTAAPVPSCGEEQAIVKFFKELNPRYLPVSFEQRLYSEQFNYAGTADIVFFDGKKGFVICDYKTGKDLYKNYMGQMMLPPFQYMLDTPFNHYQLQLSLYQIPFEECGYFVSERWIIWLRPDGSYQKLPTHDFTSMLKQSFMS